MPEHEYEICLGGADWFIHEGVNTDYDGVVGQPNGWYDSQVPGTRPSFPTSVRAILATTTIDMKYGR